MGNRILSREECEALSSEAIAFIYKNILGEYCSPDAIEKTLLQAVLVARINQCRIDVEAIEFLLEKICENDDAFMFGSESGALDSSCRYC